MNEYESIHHRIDQLGMGLRDKIRKLEDRLEALEPDSVSDLYPNTEIEHQRLTFRIAELEAENKELKRRNNEQANTILDLQKQVNLLKPWYKYTPELTKSPDETPWEFMQRIQACSDQISSDVNELRMKHEDILTNDEELNEWIMSYPREFK